MGRQRREPSASHCTACSAAIRAAVPIYGSGGFTTYTMEQLLAQLSGWVNEGIPRVKMKIGTDWGTSWRADVARIAAVREAIGDDAELFVDANGGYDAHAGAPARVASSRATSASAGSRSR